VPLAYMANIDSVGEALASPLIEKYVSKLIFDEIIPTLSLPKDELQVFANDVLNRFRNPYICHLLMSISLNSMTKFKTRLLPQLEQYIVDNKTVPALITTAIAGQILFYRGERNGQPIELSDSPEWITLFKSIWQQHHDGAITLKELVSSVLGAKWHWDKDLNELTGLTDLVTEQLNSMLTTSVEETLSKQVEL